MLRSHLSSNVGNGRVLALLLILSVLTTRARALTAGECITQFGTRGCLNQTVSCCYGEPCSKKYMSNLAQNPFWPPSYNNCFHQCPYLTNDPNWMCSPVECQDPTGTNLVVNGCPASKICIVGRCLDMVGKGSSCSYRVAKQAAYAVAYDNCNPGLYCNPATLNCQPVESIGGSCTIDRACGQNNMCDSDSSTCYTPASIFTHPRQRWYVIIPLCAVVAGALILGVNTLRRRLRQKTLATAQEKGKGRETG